MLDEIQRYEINDCIFIVCKIKKKFIQSCLISVIQIMEFVVFEGILLWYILCKILKYIWISDILGILMVINVKGIELFFFRMQMIMECNYGFYVSI